ncbi:MAG: winged helix-turn-helix domain-containing protein [Thermoanaerobaculia bacterium]
MRSRHSGAIAFGSFEYRPASHELLRRGRRVEVPHRALAVLERLLERPGEPVTRAELLAAAWSGVHVTPTSLNEAVSRLRAALGDDPKTPAFVETLPGLGYRFIATVRWSPRSGYRWRERLRRPSLMATVALVVAIGARALLETDRATPPALAARLSTAGEVIGTLDHLPFDVLDVVADPNGGGRLALAAREEGGSAIWIVGPEGESLRRLSDGGANTEPVWSPDGRWVAWASNAGGGFDIVRRRADGGEGQEPVLSAPGDQYPEWWSADGSRLVYSERSAERGFDIAVLERSRSGGWLRRTLAATAHDEYLGSFSPDARWLTYESNRTGRSEVWIEPADGSGTPVQASSGGGRDPFWSPDGKLCWIEHGTLVEAVWPVERTPVRRRVLHSPPSLLRVRAAGDGFVAVLGRAG